MLLRRIRATVRNLAFHVTATEALILKRPPTLASYFVLSPYVWREGAGYQMLVRVVNDDPDPNRKVARVYHARSSDGLTFASDDKPAIAPDAMPSDDDGGCEDPTVLISQEGYRVYYSGWSRERRQSSLLCAVGESVEELRKEPGAVIDPKTYANAKEATAVRDGDCYRLFFEYALGGASQIGHVVGAGPRGLFLRGLVTLEPRRDSFDRYHLSAGPIVDTPSGPVMFYNGANEDAHWRIGWAIFNRDYSAVLARSDEPLVKPGELTGDGTDIAFAASAVRVDDDTIWLYYSISDAHLMRATVITAELAAR